MFLSKEGEEENLIVDPFPEILPSNSPLPRYHAVLMSQHSTQGPLRFHFFNLFPSITLGGFSVSLQASSPFLHRPASFYYF
jgi:hypothetical protein